MGPFSAENGASENIKFSEGPYKVSSKETLM